jgi:hypothetical protein
VLLGRVEAIRASLAARGQLPKQVVHVLESAAFCLWIKQDDDRDAHNVDGHEEEVDAGPEAVDPHRPDLRDYHGTQGAGRGREVKPASAHGGREDLGPVDPSSGAETQAVSKGIYKNEDDAGDVGGAVDVARIYQGQGPVDLKKSLVSNSRTGARESLLPACRLPSRRTPESR